MSWTKEVPATEGYYWWRFGESVHAHLRIPRIVLLDRRDWYSAGTDEMMFGDEIYGEFSSEPILCPIP